MAFLGLFLAGINFACIPLFTVILWQKPVETGRKFLIGGGVYGVFLGIFTAFNFGGAFGPGVIPYMSSFLFGPLAVVGLAVTGIFFYRAKQESRARWMYSVGSLVLIFMQISPVLGHTFIGGFCDRKTRQAGEPIILAVNEYVKVQGHYPETLDALIPDYLTEIPVGACFVTFHPAAHFEIEPCEAGPILVTTTFDFSKDMRYFFKTGEWSSISFLDGACSFLE